MKQDRTFSDVSAYGSVSWCADTVAHHVDVPAGAGVTGLDDLWEDKDGNEQ